MRLLNKDRRVWLTGLVSGIIGLALLMPAASGAARLPDTDNHKIVPNRSIGGVKLDMSLQRVKQLWGKGACTTTPATPGPFGTPAQVSCDWGVIDPTKGEHAHVTFLGNGPGATATIITIYARRKASTGEFVAGTLSKWKTAANIHLGSPVSKVPEAYPAAKRNTGEAVQGWDLFSGTRPNLRYTRFATGPTGGGGRLMTISMEWDYCHNFPC